MQEQLRCILKIYYDPTNWQPMCDCDLGVEIENEIDLLEPELDTDDKFYTSGLSGEQLLYNYRLLFPLNGSQVCSSNVFLRPLTPSFTKRTSVSISTLSPYTKDHNNYIIPEHNKRNVSSEIAYSQGDNKNGNNELMIMGVGDADNDKGSLKNASKNETEKNVEQNDNVIDVFQSQNEFSKINFDLNNEMEQFTRREMNKHSNEKSDEDFPLSNVDIKYNDKDLLEINDDNNSEDVKKHYDEIEYLIQNIIKVENKIKTCEDQQQKIIEENEEIIHSKDIQNMKNENVKNKNTRKDENTKNGNTNTKNEKLKQSKTNPKKPILKKRIDTSIPIYNKNKKNSSKSNNKIQGTKDKNNNKDNKEYESYNENTKKNKKPKTPIMDTLTVPILADNLTSASNIRTTSAFTVQKSCVARDNGLTDGIYYQHDHPYCNKHSVTNDKSAKGDKKISRYTCPCYEQMKHSFEQDQEREFQITSPNR